MTETIKETVVTRNNANTNVSQSAGIEATSSQTLEYLVYFAFGVVEILLLFRLVFKFLGAGAQGVFVEIIYSITNLFVLPFEGIFRSKFNQGIETTSIFEPSVLVAIVVYAVLAWGIVKLIRISSGERQLAN